LAKHKTYYRNKKKLNKKEKEEEEATKSIKVRVHFAKELMINLYELSELKFKNEETKPKVDFDLIACMCVH
jgi:arabinogalactan endo-1,4-beta-galactosidase